MYHVIIRYYFSGNFGVSTTESHSGDTISKLLLEETTINPTEKNNRGQTPLDLTLHPDVIRELIRHGASPRDVYETHGKVLGKHSSKQPLQTPVKLFMVGNPSAGKSTLTKALQSEAFGLKRITKWIVKVSGVDEKTAGIVPHEFESKTYGRVTLYDFAGQREFYGCHAALLQNAIQTSTPIFLLVVDLSASNDDIKSNIFYWLSFLENQCTSVSRKPHIVVIGSHADVLKSRDEVKHKASFITSVLTAPQFASLEFTGFVAMDCQYADSAGMTELHQALKTSCDSLRSQENINFNAHCFLVYLLDKFRNATALTLATIQAQIKEDLDQAETSADDVMSFVPASIHSLCAICYQLNDRGHLLVLMDPTAIEDSWVIINRTVLLAEVNGTIFAPEGFKEYIKLASSTGVVPLSKITEHFPNHDRTMLVGFLSHLEFCHEIADSEILGLINEEQTSTASKATAVQGERYFFFPGLVTLEVPSTVWEPQPQFDYHCGWMLQFSALGQFFYPRFVQVLLLRLAFSFAFSKLPSTDVPSLQRKCAIWKNGIYWGDGNNTEVLVEIAEQNRVVVLMRCREVNSEYLHTRSLLIQKVLAAAREFCSKVSTVESFINPSDTTQYPLKPTSQLALYDMTEVATAVAKGESSIVQDTGETYPLDSLLSFEPYADLGEPILRELFQKASPQCKEVLSQTLVSDIAERIPKKKGMLKALFKPKPALLAQRMSKAGFVSDELEVMQMLDIWKNQTEGTYQCLREKLDQFSVFAGRNPLVSCTNGDVCKKSFTECSDCRKWLVCPVRAAHSPLIAMLQSLLRLPQPWSVVRWKAQSIGVVCMQFLVVYERITPRYRS